MKTETIKYTPGPWDVTRVMGRTCYKIYSPDVTSELQARANLKLISAAPELLEALRRVVPWLGKMIADKAHLNAVAPNDAVGALQQAEAAITKAI